MSATIGQGTCLICCCTLVWQSAMMWHLKPLNCWGTSVAFLPLTVLCRGLWVPTSAALGLAMLPTYTLRQTHHTFSSVTPCYQACQSSPNRLTQHNTLLTGLQLLCRILHNTSCHMLQDLQGCGAVPADL